MGNIVYIMNFRWFDNFLFSCSCCGFVGVENGPANKVAKKNFISHFIKKAYLTWLSSHTKFKLWTH